jgi:hypothetical protein
MAPRVAPCSVLWGLGILVSVSLVQAWAQLEAYPDRPMGRLLGSLTDSYVVIILGEYGGGEMFPQHCIL